MCWRCQRRRFAPVDLAARADLVVSVIKVGKAERTFKADKPSPIRKGRKVDNVLPARSVLVMQNGQPQPVPVTEGLTVGDLTEVSGDLQEGDQVIVITTTRTTMALAGGSGWTSGWRLLPRRRTTVW